jgi:hypothetical protein
LAPPRVLQLELLRRSIVEGPAPGPGVDFEITRAVLDRIGVGLEPAHVFIGRERPSANQLDRWLQEQVGGAIDAVVVEDANAIAVGQVTPARRSEQARIELTDPVLSAGDLAFWAEHGYVVVPAAAPPRACAALRQAIFEHIGAAPDDPESWYDRHLNHGIMVQLFHAPGIADIHASMRIHKAFAQVAGTTDLIMSSDRCGFNAPVRPDHPYTGARLHFDLPSFDPPVASHLQGILYLSDTGESQGAFRCVPGFHRRIDAWLESLAPSRDPNQEDLEALGPVPIAAANGDLIIWDARLPHGPGPNTATEPRIVHYLRMYPRPVPAEPALVSS